MKQESFHEQNSSYENLFLFFTRKNIRYLIHVVWNGKRNVKNEKFHVARNCHENRVIRIVRDSHSDTCISLSGPGYLVFRRCIYTILHTFTYKRTFSRPSLPAFIILFGRPLHSLSSRLSFFFFFYPSRPNLIGGLFFQLLSALWIIYRAR